MKILPFLKKSKFSLLKFQWNSTTAIMQIHNVIDGMPSKVVLPAIYTFRLCKGMHYMTLFFSHTFLYMISPIYTDGMNCKQMHEKTYTEGQYRVFVYKKTSFNIANRMKLKLTLHTVSFLFKFSGLKKLVKWSKYENVNFITNFG